MAENVFLDGKQSWSLAEYMNYDGDERGNLGGDIPVVVYRLLEYSVREQLLEQFGKEQQVQIFRDAGYRAGVYFSQNILDEALEVNEYIALLQKTMEELKIGVLRIEQFDRETGKMVLTVSEDADCSGLPLLGETVCNYDEGFIAGVLSSYMKKEYQATEVDCWATGNRVCRFRVEPRE